GTSAELLHRRDAVLVTREKRVCLPKQKARDEPGSGPPERTVGLRQHRVRSPQHHRAHQRQASLEESTKAVDVTETVAARNVTDEIRREQRTEPWVAPCRTANAEAVQQSQQQNHKNVLRR